MYAIAVATRNAPSLQFKQERVSGSQVPKASRADHQSPGVAVLSAVGPEVIAHVEGAGMNTDIKGSQASVLSASPIFPAELHFLAVLRVAGAPLSTSSIGKSRVSQTRTNR